MVFFFFVIGLELRRELEMGGLTDTQRAAVPLVASVAGLAVPALVFLAISPSGEAARAWGVVISTDTAFLLGVLAVAGPAFSAPLRLFLLTMAVADDIGALSIIALFYTEDLRLVPLAVAAVGLFAIVKLRHLQVWQGPAYLIAAAGGLAGDVRVRGAPDDRRRGDRAAAAGPPAAPRPGRGRRAPDPAVPAVAVTRAGPRGPALGRPGGVGQRATPTVVRPVGDVRHRPGLRPRQRRRAARRRHPRAPQRARG